MLAAQNDTIRVSTRLVQVNVVVRDKNGPVAGLKVSDFTVLDNKKEQKIEVFSVLDGRSLPPIVLPSRTVQFQTSWIRLDRFRMARRSFSSIC